MSSFCAKKNQAIVAAALLLFAQATPIMANTDAALADSEVAIAQEGNSCEVAAEQEALAIVQDTKKVPAYVSPRSGEKHPFKLDAGDLTFTLGGTATIDTVNGKNTTFLNSHLPDNYGYMRQTVDLVGDVIWGEQTFGHKAFEFYFDIRQKAIFGNGGRLVSTTKSGIRVANSFLGMHDHVNNKLIVWLRGAYVELSLNALFGNTTGNIQYIRIGHFPFVLGRGISLGPVYGASKDYLGMYTTYLSDTQTPGICMHGDLVEDVLSYDLYWGMLQNNSTSLSDTLFPIRAHHVGRAFTPWRGAGKNNDVVAARLFWTACDNSKAGKLTLEPYMLYNNAEDMQVELAADARFKMGIGGLAVEYSNGNFEFGAEGAIDFGTETLENVDRNSTRIKADCNGYLLEEYSHIVAECLDCYGNPTNCPNDKKPLARTDETKKLVTQTRTFGSCNGEKIGTATICGNTVNVFNASNRYRPCVQKELLGWMVVTDASYKINTLNTKFAATYAYVSGDTHENFALDDKRYTGFIGLLEGYTGKRVQSLFVLDARKLKRPFTFQPNENEAGDDLSFTDLQFTGVNATWYPLREEKQLFLATNLLWFWKAQPLLFGNGSPFQPLHCPPSLFMGTEWNVVFNYEAMKGLNFWGNLAMFFPGGFYRDIAGIPLRGDLFNSLDVSNKAPELARKLRLSTSIAYILNLGLTYKF